MLIIKNGLLPQKTVLLLFSLLLSLFSHAVMANEIVVAIPEPEAPYYNRLDDTGVEMDIIRAAFKHAGHTILPYYIVEHDYEDIPPALNNGDFDCVTSLPPYVGLHSFYSDPLVPHPVVAISLTKNKLQLNSIADLQTVNFIPFRNASDELEEAYQKMLKQHKTHRKQIKNATKMVNMLFRGDIPVIIMDKHIFEHNRDWLGERPERMQKVDYHDIFKPLSYPLTCKKESISRKFNQSLRILRKNGQYQAIIKRYFDDNNETKTDLKTR